MRRTIRYFAVLIALSVVAASCTTADETAVPGSTRPVAGPSSTGPVLLDSPAAPPPEPPSIIPLLRTVGGGDVAFGGVMAMTSHVLAANPISRLELWVDTEMVESHEFAVPVVDPTFPWEWTADSVGLHAATVRAFDVEGRTVGSFPSWSRVYPGWDITNGQLLEGLPVSPLEATTNAVSLDPASCEATVLVAAAPGSLGQTVSGITLGVGGYRAIAVVGEAGGPVSVPMAFSPVILSVEPYDAELATPAAPIAVPGAPECASGTWTGDFTFNGATLVGADTVDNAYLYVTEDDSTWRRVPETGFVARGSAGFDFTGLLPSAAAGGFVDVEAWGWGGGQLEGLGRARYAAAAADTVDPTWGSALPVTPFSSLNIVRRTTDPNTQIPEERLLLQDIVCVDKAINPTVCGPSPQTLRWNSHTLGAEAGLVQVSSESPPPGPVLTFPGLLWSTMIAMDSDPVREFPLDIAFIREGTELTAELDTGGATVVDAGSFDMTDLDGMGRELSVVAQPAAPGSSPRMSVAVLGTWSTPIAPSRLWVRVIPFTNGVPIEGISNPVLFETEDDGLTVTTVEDLAKEAQAAFDALYDVEAEFSQPRLGNESYSHCVRVVANPFGDENPVPSGNTYSIHPGYWKAQFDAFRNSATVYSHAGNQKIGLVPGATVCAYKPDPPDKDFFDYVAEGLSFITEAWDTFKNLVDMVKNGIIKGIVDITGCTPEQTCVAALTALADAGLASIGVPPSLPSFRELAEAAKGDIAAALAKKLVGEVCPIPCEAFAAQFIDDALDDIEKHFSGLAASQAQSGGWVLHLNPDIRVIAEPAGQLFPGSVKVRITRKPGGQPDPSVPTYCAVGLATDGVGPLTWRDRFGKQHTNEVVSGQVFTMEWGGASLLELKSGESVTIGVASLDFNRSVYLPGAWSSYPGMIPNELNQSIQLWQDPDTELVMHASTCGGSFTETFKRNLKGSSPVDIPTS